MHATTTTRTLKQSNHRIQPAPCPSVRAQRLLRQAPSAAGSPTRSSRTRAPAGGRARRPPRPTGWDGKSELAARTGGEER